MSTAADQHVHLSSDQLGRQCRQTVEVTLGDSPLNHQVLPFFISKFAQTLREFVEVRHLSARLEETDSPNLGALLSKPDPPGNEQTACSQQEPPAFLVTHGFSSQEV